MGISTRAALPLLLAVTAAAYLGALHAGFVWDDIPLVVRNTLTADLRNLPAFFSSDLWAGTPVGDDTSGYYRPLMLLDLAIDRALFGLSAPMHHARGLLWHLAAIAVVHRLLRHWLAAPGALLGAALFALHPIQSEAVVWVAARNDLMAAALGLGALVLALPPRPSNAKLLGAGALTILAGLSKESVILLPMLLLAADLAAPPGERAARRYAPLLGGLGVVIALRLLAGVSAAPPPEGWALLVDAGPRLWGLIGAGVFAPWPLSIGYALEWIDRLSSIRLAIGGAALTAFLLAATLRGGRAGRVGAAWFFIALAPLVLPLADKGLHGERYLYLPLVGIGLAAGALLGRRGPLVAVALAPFALLAIHARLLDWVSDVTLWEAAVADTPSAYTHAGLGHAYLGAGHQALAAAEFQAALSDPLPDLTVCPRMIGAALRAGDPAAAARLGGWAEARGCEDGVFFGQYAVALALTGRWQMASRALAHAPPDPEGRADVVRGALARQRGDEAAFDALAAGWPDGGAGFTAQVEGLLQHAPR